MLLNSRNTALIIGAIVMLIIIAIIEVYERKLPVRNRAISRVFSFFTILYFFELTYISQFIVNFSKAPLKSLLMMSGLAGASILLCIIYWKRHKYDMVIERANWGLIRDIVLDELNGTGLPFHKVEYRSGNETVLELHDYTWEVCLKCTGLFSATANIRFVKYWKMPCFRDFYSSLKPMLEVTVSEDVIKRRNKSNVVGIIVSVIIIAVYILFFY